MMSMVGVIMVSSTLRVDVTQSALISQRNMSLRSGMPFVLEQCMKTWWWILSRANQIIAMIRLQRIPVQPIPWMLSIMCMSRVGEGILARSFFCRLIHLEFYRPFRNSLQSRRCTIFCLAIPVNLQEQKRVLLPHRQRLVPVLAPHFCLCDQESMRIYCVNVLKYTRFDVISLTPDGVAVPLG